MERVIMLIDCQSFYASVEKAAHPEYKNDPVVVAGDPSRRSGIILAACPLAKQYGVTTAETLGEALGKCPHLVIIRPRMQAYIEVSLMITDIFRSFTDLVEPFSIDEQFLDVTGSLSYFGTPDEIATQIQTKIMLYTGVWARVGISSNKILAKMATDIWAKKNEAGVFTLPKTAVESLLWPLPVNKMFGVGSRMTAHFERMGISTIGDLGRLPLPDFKRKLRARMGRNSDIQAELFWQTANGIDPSPVKPSTHDAQQAVGHQMTLPRDYSKPQEIDVVLLELSEEVCRRSRAKGYMGSVVAAGAQGADFDRPTGFFRQMTVPDPTNITKEVFAAARTLFYAHWDRLPVRKLGVTLSKLVPDDQYQLSLFGNREKERKLDRVTDAIRHKFGTTSILRASSLLEAAQARERSVKIGGHYK
ncbi:DNA polymerase IV [Paenibacillus lupini]|jgi:DNA polymerase-4|uniref:DNA polymerase IV n=1 Tax=Paenibacillus lupini TaxID=1450204 RepID=UPI00141F27A6|nr:DNA polymerase IV [Paenibacillus lupini]NIK22642.1 DNA polymerase-4 [Paenibacillus lupini]